MNTQNVGYLDTVVLVDSVLEALADEGIEAQAEQIDVNRYSITVETDDSEMATYASGIVAGIRLYYRQLVKAELI